MHTSNSPLIPGLIMLPSGEEIPLPGGFDAGELSLPGNCRFVHADLLYAYDPTTSTGLAWCRAPAPHWQLIQPVTRQGFEEWASSHCDRLSLQMTGEMLKSLNDIVERAEKAKERQA